MKNLASGKTVNPDDYPLIVELNEKKLPQIKGWEVGKTYKLILEVEQVGLDKGYDGNEPIRARFKVLNAKSAGEIARPTEAAKQAPSRDAKLAALKDKATKV